MKTAILGGSFDPIHNGHLSLAENVYLELAYEKIIFFPAFVSPFKQTSKPLSKEDRLNMLILATENNPHFLVDDFELRKQGVSYTIETVEYCYKNYAIKGKLGLIIGADLLEKFYAWKDAKKLLSLVELIVGERPAKRTIVAGKKVPLEKKKKLKFSIPSFTQLKNESLQISSSYIRAAIAENKAWRYLVPEKIYDYIVNNGLYKNE
ncbi:MAG: nicotinate (nicotinamide) nucleotide adenylyltransferase [Treponemataceae bacterium]